MRYLGLVLAAAAVLLVAQSDTLTLDQDHPAIRWISAPVSDPISDVNQKLQNGTLTLSSEGTLGYLPGVLKALNIPLASQMLVYSKTSLQRGLIHPKNPRAFYFNDTATVGYIAGSPMLEAAVLDPRQGVIFYTLNQQTEYPRFVRQTSCTTCHETQLGVPGFVLQSMPTAADGQALYQLGYYPATDRTPFENRWGGWFVTGRHAAFAHMGNQTVANPREPGPLAVAAAGLAEAPIRGYPLATSDIVALLVYEHQAETSNWITRLGWHARMVAFNKQPLSQLQPTVNALVDALLFTGEQALPTVVAGTSGFAEQFAQRGPRDKRGRSLRELDLKRHVFRYPLSYLIYSPAFEALPDEALAMVYQRLWDVLSGRIAPGDGKTDNRSRFDLATRIAIAEIVSETKLGLPPYWQAVTLR